MARIHRTYQLKRHLLRDETMRVMRCGRAGDKYLWTTTLADVTCQQCLRCVGAQDRLSVTGPTR
jgi:hypothetical protein